MTGRLLGVGGGGRGRRGMSIEVEKKPFPMGRRISLEKRNAEKPIEINE